jgi:quinol monooxygenase YgiN
MHRHPAARAGSFLPSSNLDNKESAMTLSSSMPAIALAVTWEARAGEADAVADILRRMALAVRSEPGTLRFEPHRSASNDHVFFLYELFADDAAFVAHQQTPHFKDLIVEQGLPRLVRRERVPFTPLTAA